MNYWILQSNPNYFRILHWLRDFDWLGDNTLVDCWNVSQLAEEVTAEDIVFIWKSKGKSDIRGIYAKGKVKPVPKRFPLADKEKGYLVGERGKAEMRRLDNLPEIAVRYTDLYLAKPLLSHTIESILELRGLTILRSWRRGIFRVEVEQGRSIESLLG